MPPLFGALATIEHVLRLLVAVVVGILAIVCVLDWLVRTRRVNAFGPIARFMRQTVSPLLDPVERSVIRAGGLPSAAPWWTLALAIVVGIVFINAVHFVFSQIVMVTVYASQGGPGLFYLLVSWTFSLLQIALLVRVVVSWLPISPYSPWVRWAFALTEPILRPLRNVVPTLGAFDITPIIAYFGLQLLERALLGFFTGM